MDSKNLDVEASSFNSQLKLKFKFPSRVFEKNSIFKYGSFKYLAKTLGNNTLKFSSFSEYNDPFEIDYSINLYMEKSDKSDYDLINSYDFQNPDDSDELLEAYDKRELLVKKIKNFAKSYFAEYVVTCFSKSPSISLMWSHYSDEHRGVCYCFNRDNIFDNSKFKSDNIIYSSELPQLHYYKNSDFKYLKPQLFNVMLTKSLDWAYEKEVRFFTQTNNTTFPYHPKSLQSIIMGSRISDNDLVSAKELVSDYNKNHQTNVEIFYANKSLTEYEMVINDFRVNGYSINKIVFED